MVTLVAPLAVADIAAEKARVVPRAYAVPQAPDLPFGLQSPRQFELLAHALLEAEIAPTGFYDRVALMPEGADGGADLLLYAANHLVGVVQCKRYITRIGRDVVLGELINFLLCTVAAGRMLPKALRYQFWTAGNLTREAAALFGDPRGTLAAITDKDLDGLIRSTQAQAKGLASLALDQDLLESLREQIRSISPTHAGPENIARRLAIHTAVRAQFFRTPADTAAQPSVADVEAHMAARRLEQQTKAKLAGRAGDAPFASPAGLVERFDDFLASDADAFVLIGGSGRGKSTWSARLQERPPIGYAVDVLAAHEIALGDDNVATTLARILARRPGAVGDFEAMQRAVWSWLDSANRVVVIDGLDRAIDGVRSLLRSWVDASLGLCATYPLRLALTSRPETWQPISVQLEPHVIDKLYWPDRGRQREGSAVSYRIAALEHHEARALYGAYGLAPDLHGRRPLNTPGLIARFASLRDRRSDKDVTRFDVVRQQVAQAAAEVGERGFGRASVEAFLDRLGGLLRATADGRAAIGTAVEGREIGQIIDAFLQTDLLVLLGSDLRAEPDEVAEYIGSRTLDLLTAIEALAVREGEPLFLGMIGMAGAQMERDKPQDLEAVLDQLLKTSGRQRHVQRAVVRILIETRDHHRLAPQIRTLLQATCGLAGYPLVDDLEDLARSLRLPADHRLDMILDLADEEDADDWRSKFWTDQESYGRFMTPFARIAAATVRADVSASIPWLVQGMIAGAPRGYILHGLLLDAAPLAPDMAIAAVWSERWGACFKAFLDLVYLYPLAAARQIEAASEGKALDHDIADRLWQLSQHHKPDADEDIVGGLARTAQQLLPKTSKSAEQVLLKMTMARAAPLEKDAQADLASHWENIDRFDVWSFIRFCPLFEDMLLDRLFADLVQGHDRGGALSVISGPAPFEPLLTRLALHAGSSDPEVVRTVSLATERLLHDQEHRPSVDPRLTALARTFAASPQASVREPMIYFAGSKVRGARATAAIAYRDALLQILVDHEQGDTLDTLMWKLAESAQQRGRAAERVCELCRRLGTARVEPFLTGKFMLHGKKLLKPVRRLLRSQGLEGSPA